jgi:hypothetical protein
MLVLCGNVQQAWGAVAAAVKRLVSNGVLSEGSKLLVSNTTCARFCGYLYRVMLFLCVIN